MTITSMSHPLLFAAFEMISHDRGSQAGHKRYAVPPGWHRSVDLVECALNALTLEERETFCIGDEDSTEKLAARSMMLSHTHNFLNAFFHDWNEDMIVIELKTKVTREFTFTLSKSALIDILNKDPNVMSHQHLPPDTRVSIKVPSGSDYSGCRLDLDDAEGVTFEWKEVK